jgi:hypothetical protein
MEAAIDAKMGETEMTMTVYSNKTVSLDGRQVGRIDRDSFQKLTHVQGTTTFYTASGDVLKTGYDTPHIIDDPLYIPSRHGSVSDWKVNPEFVAAVSRIVA